MKPKFSFIIPTMNEGNYLEGCMASIRNQTRKDHEVIVVDTNSTDSTRAIARKYGARILSEPRRGPGVARNTGARHARGDVLVFADADVRFGADFLEKLGRKFGSGIGGCIFTLKLYDAKHPIHSLGYYTANFLARLMIAANMPVTAGSCFAYRKSLFKKLGGFNISFATNEDHELAGRAGKMAPFVFSKDILVRTSSRRLIRMGFRKILRVYFKSSAMYFFNKSYVRNSSYWQH